MTDNLLCDAIVKDLCPICDYWQFITDGPIITINNPFKIYFKGRVYLPYEIEKQDICEKGL